MLIKLTKKTSSKLALALCVSIISTYAYANNTDSSMMVKSISYNVSTDIDENSKTRQLKLETAEIMQPLVKQGFRAESNMLSSKSESISYTLINDYTIYNVSTEIISDFDYDGFFHRFSVTVDADTVFNTSYVYAKLYLSYEGGPWNYLTSSNAYHIYGDSELDSFTIESELVDGFPAGYYDVRIELYDADYNHLLLSYGPYNDSSLSSLPLEASYYDDNHITEIYPIQTDVIVTGRGATNLWVLIIPIMILLARTMRSKNKRDE